MQLLQRALKIDPDNPSFLDSLGWAYFQQGKLAEADQPLTRAAEQLPTSSVVQEHLGDLRFKQQRFADAAHGVGAGAGGRRPVGGSREDREEDPRRPRPPGPAVIGPAPADPPAPRGGALALLIACHPPAAPARSGPAFRRRGSPFPDAAAAYAEATAACRGVRTLSAELALSGRAGGQKLRGRILAGFAAPGKVRLEAPAPFGRPIFTLVAARRRRDAGAQSRGPRAARRAARRS